MKQFYNNITLLLIAIMTGNYKINYLQMKNGWLEKQKLSQDILTELKCPTVYRHQLNQMQKFAFDIIQKYHIDKQQLLMIINGGAGSGKTTIIKKFNNLNNFL